MGNDATQLLEALAQGDRSAADKLLPIVYEDLHRIAQRYMRSEPGGRQALVG